MTIEEVSEVFKKKQPYRRPVKYARAGDTWYIYSENTANGGKHLSTLIENCYFSVDGERVLPTTPLDMPRDLSFIPVPAKFQEPYMPQPDK